jgi:hypothetical protein
VKIGPVTHQNVRHIGPSHGWCLGLENHRRWLGSKATTTVKTAALRKKRRVPMIGDFAAIYLEESSKSSPHVLAAQCSDPEIPLRLEPRAPSPVASLPVATSLGAVFFYC